MRVYIESLQQARRELAKVYKNYKDGAIDSDNARTKVHILRAIIEANFKYEIESRIIELEKRAGI
jgi:hypothetical protein